MNVEEQTLRFIPECSQIDDALARLAKIVEMFPVVREDIVAFLESEHHVIELDVIDQTTASAGYIRVLLKPSDSLLSFIAALRARHG